MNILITHELKKYFDTYKVGDILRENNNVTCSSIHPTDEKVLLDLIKSKETLKIKEFLSNISLSIWKNFTEEISKLKLFHITYFIDNTSLHSTGIDVYGIDMADACDKFISQMGIEPYICVTKTKSNEKM